MTYPKRLLALALAIVALTFLVDSTSAAAFKRVFEGDPAPLFSLPDLDGNLVNLEDYSAGPLTIVVFWSTWSPKSGPLLTDIQKLLDEFSSDTVQVTALAVNAEGEQVAADFEDSVRAFVADNGIKFPVLLDREMEEYNKWGVIATPSTAFLGKGLKVVYEFSGHPTSAYEDMRAEVMEVLGLKETAEEAAKPRRQRYEADKKVTLNYGLCRTLFERGQFSKAARKLKRVLSDDPQFPDAHSLNGLIHLGQAQVENGAALATAREAFQKALELDATDPKALAGSAHFALADGNTKAALAGAREAVQYTEPEDLPALPTSDAEGEQAPAAAEAPAGEAEAALTARLDQAASLLEAGNDAEAQPIVAQVVDALLAIPVPPEVKGKGKDLLQMMKKPE